jgi:hypothetical protein
LPAAGFARLLCRHQFRRHHRAGRCNQRRFVCACRVLPGKGLAQHDFLYTGEGREERLFIVRSGQVVWSYTHPGRGEISEAVLEPDGHILFAHQFGITEITLDKKVVWNFDAPPGTEIHTAKPIGTNSVMFIENANPAKLIVINKTTGAIEHQFEMPVKFPDSVHRQFRRAQVTAAGTVLVSHLDLGKIVEYDWDGKALWSHDLTNCWSAVELANGNILAATSGNQFVREINRKGETVWEWTAADAPEYKFSNTQQHAGCAPAERKHAHQQLVQPAGGQDGPGPCAGAGHRSHAGQKNRLGLAFMDAARRPRPVHDNSNSRRHACARRSARQRAGAASVSLHRRMGLSQS